MKGGERQFRFSESTLANIWKCFSSRNKRTHGDFIVHFPICREALLVEAMLGLKAVTLVESSKQSAIKDWTKLRFAWQLHKCRSVAMSWISLYFTSARFSFPFIPVFVACSKTWINWTIGESSGLDLGGGGNHFASRAREPFLENETFMSVCQIQASRMGMRVLVLMPAVFFLLGITCWALSFSENSFQWWHVWNINGNTFSTS